MTRRWTARLWLKALVFLLALLGAGVLAQAWQVHKVEVVGVRRFDATAIGKALEDALGKPPLLASASTLRKKLLAVPWVADAQVVVGLDGSIRCLVQERTPAAILTDGQPWQLVDAQGKILGPAGGELDLPQLSGFAPYPEERARVLSILPTLAATWGQPVVSCQRLGARDVAVLFAHEPLTVVLDPQHPETLVHGKQVLSAWNKANLGPVARLDLRVAGKVFVQPVVSE